MCFSLKLYVVIFPSTYFHLQLGQFCRLNRPRCSLSENTKIYPHPRKNCQGHSDNWPQLIPQKCLKSKLETSSCRGFKTTPYEAPKRSGRSFSLVCYYIYKNPISNIQLFNISILCNIVSYWTLKKRHNFYMFPWGSPQY